MMCNDWFRGRLSTLFAPFLYELHKEIKAEAHDEIWLKGGRGSTKSTFISIQILYLAC
jgi:phage terminase large subunit